MKKIIAVITLVCSVSTYGKTAPKLFKPGSLNPMKIEGVGTVTAQLKKSSAELQKAGLPLQLDLHFECEDHRSTPNSVTPKPQLILQNHSLCHFYWPPTFDRKTQTMTIYYALPKIEKDHSQTCDEYRSIDFILNETCEIWQR